MDMSSMPAVSSVPYKLQKNSKIGPDFADLAAQGLTAQQLATHYGCSISGVMYYAARRGIVLTKSYRAQVYGAVSTNRMCEILRDGFAAGKTSEQIFHEQNWLRSRVYARLSKARISIDSLRPPSQQKLNMADVCEMVGQGLSIKEISQKIGVSPSWIYSCASLQNIRLSKLRPKGYLRTGQKSVDWDAVRDLCAKGESVDDIARRFEMSAVTLRAHARAVKFDFKAHRPRKPAPQRKPPKNARPTVDLEVAQQMLNKGHSVAKIAAAMRVSTAAVSRHIRKGRLQALPKEKLRAMSAPAAPAAAMMAMAARGAAALKPAVTETPDAPVQRARRRRAPVLLPPSYDNLPHGYVSGLIESKGRYAALEAWRAKYATPDRPISPAKALQEWHKHRGPA